jgi:hypothetical protein
MLKGDAFWRRRAASETGAGEPLDDLRGRLAAERLVALLSRAVASRTSR